jgi:hypothetical protein
MRMPNILHRAANYELLRSQRVALPSDRIRWQRADQMPCENALVCENRWQEQQLGAPRFS